MSIYGLDPFEKPPSGPLGPKVVFIGEIEKWQWQWSIRSQTDLLVRYELTLDFRDGTVHCSCPHAVARLNRYRPTIYDGCKHCLTLVDEAARILEERNQL